MTITYKDEAVKAYIENNDMMDDLLQNCEEVSAEEGVVDFNITYDDSVEEWYINF